MTWRDELPILMPQAKATSAGSIEPSAFGLPPSARKPIGASFVPAQKKVETIRTGRMSFFGAMNA